jgi:hypothetical protein
MCSLKRGKMRLFVAIAVEALLLAVIVNSVSGNPQQIRLSLNLRQDEMTVSWVTPYWAGTSLVSYGTVNDVNELRQRVWTQDNDKYDFKGGYGNQFYARSVKLTGLEQATTYFYRVGNDKQGWSSIFNFRARAADINATTTFAVVADQVILRERFTHSTQLEYMRNLLKILHPDRGRVADREKYRRETNGEISENMLCPVARITWSAHHHR